MTVDNKLRNLIVVAGHAAFRRDIREIPDRPEADETWVLAPFQAGEPPRFIEHIRVGLSLAAETGDSLLIFSGGFTHRNAGDWSEARTYRAIANAKGWIRATSDDSRPSLDLLPEERVAIEERARDSFENLLFSICRFHEVVGIYPQSVTVVGWAFKNERFQLHRTALRYPKDRFHYCGPNDPDDLEQARRGEKATIALFRADPFGTEGPLAKKRLERDPFSHGPSELGTEGIKPLLTTLAKRKGTEAPTSDVFPWED